MTDATVRSIDGRYYTDPEVFENELDRVFAHTWQMIGHVSQLATAGDLITARRCISCRCRGASQTNLLDPFPGGRIQHRHQF